MASPVTGPASVINTVIDPLRAGHYLLSDDRLKWRQAKPYNLSLAYFRRYASLRNWTPFCTLDHGANQAASGSQPPFAVRDKLLAIAYERLKGEIRDQAQMAVAFAELPEAVQMIASRFRQLYDFGRKLRRGDLLGASRALALPKPPKRARVRRTFSDNYLEFHFGWSPLLADIYSAMQVLMKEPVTGKVKGRKSELYYRFFQNGVPNVDGYNRRQWVGRLRVQQGCQVRVVNPNLALANALGLLNPAIVVWELIPFSFLVDYLVNFGDVLQSMTDFMGLAIEQPYWTVATNGMYNEESFTTFQNRGLQFQYGPFYHQQRELGLVGPTLHVRPWQIPGWRRMAAIASLAIGFTASQR